MDIVALDLEKSSFETIEKIDMDLIKIAVDMEATVGLDKVVLL